MIDTLCVYGRSLDYWNLFTFYLDQERVWNIFFHLPFENFGEEKKSAIWFECKFSDPFFNTISMRRQIPFEAAMDSLDRESFSLLGLEMAKNWSFYCGGEHWESSLGIW